MRRRFASPAWVEPRSDRVKPRFHGECDVAALVYGRGDDPDALLRAFAVEVAARGHDVLGVVQSRPIGSTFSQNALQFEMLGEDVASASRVLVDIELEEVANRLGASLGRRPDLLVLNRYGTNEASGGGLMSALSTAIELDIPVVIGVPEALFPRWLDLADGLAVRLRPRLDSLNAWWRALKRAPSRPVSGPSICEMLK